MQSRPYRNALDFVSSARATVQQLGIPADNSTRLAPSLFTGTIPLNNPEDDQRRSLLSMMYGNDDSAETAMNYLAACQDFLSSGAVDGAADPRAVVGPFSTESKHITELLSAEWDAFCGATDNRSIVLSTVVQHYETLALTYVSVKNKPIIRCDFTLGFIDPFIQLPVEMFLMLDLARAAVQNELTAQVTTMGVNIRCLGVSEKVFE